MEARSHFLPPLSGRSPVNCLPETGFLRLAEGPFGPIFRSGRQAWQAARGIAAGDAPPRKPVAKRDWGLFEPSDGQENNTRICLNVNRYPASALL
jgi:hypothetical protein